MPFADTTASPDGLQVAVSKEQVKDAPNIDQDGELTAQQQSDVYRHHDLLYTPASAPSSRRLANKR